jgi:hypothetical protein
MPAAKNRAGQTCGAAKRPVAVVVIVIVIVIIGAEKVLGKEGTRVRAPDGTDAAMGGRCFWRETYTPPGMNSLVCNYLS